jgi:hypothetical protein
MLTDNREKTLRRISIDLAMWQAGQPTPAATGHLLTLFLSCAGSVWLSFTWIPLFPVSCLASVIACVTWRVVCQKCFAGQPVTWPQRMDGHLSAYQPRHAAAWHHLQACVRDKGELTPQDVAQWLRHERATEKPGAGAGYQFLHHLPGKAPEDD